MMQMKDQILLNLRNAFHYIKWLLYILFMIVYVDCSTDKSKNDSSDNNIKISHKNIDNQNFTNNKINSKNNKKKL